MGIKALKGRNVRIEVALTYGTPKAVTAVTKASPGVATSTGHGLTTGQVGYFANVVGMSEIDGQAAAVDNSTTNSFDLTDIDASGYSTWGTGDFVPVLTWATLANATKIDLAGGDASTLDVTTLLDTTRQQENGMLAAQTVSIDVMAEQVTNSAAKALRTAARGGGFVVIRATYPNGSRRIFRGQPSMPGESTSIDQPVTGSMSVTVKGYVIMTDL